MTTTVFLAPAPILNTQFIPGGNTPANGAQLFSYITGSSTKLATYTTSSGAVANSNPIVLDSGGNLTGSREVWLIQSSTYRFILAPSTDTDPPVSPYWTMDSITGLNDNSFSLVTAEWVKFSGTPTGSGLNTFTLTGDQTALFSPGRRVQIIVGAQTVYGNVSSATFSVVTTIGMSLDGGALDLTGVTSVNYGIISTPNGSIPWTQSSTTGLTINGITNISSATVTTATISTMTVNGPVTFNTGPVNVSTYTASTASVINQLTTASTCLLSFYGVSATTQATNVSTVATTGSVSTAGLFGFTTSTQANALFSTVNLISAVLKRYGLTT